MDAQGGYKTVLRGTARIGLIVLFLTQGPHMRLGGLKENSFKNSTGQIRLRTSYFMSY